MIASLLYRLTGREYHFKVLITYYPFVGQNQPSVDRYINVSVKDRSLITNDRAIKKATANNMVALIPAKYRTNGVIVLREIYYLGWFRP